MEGGDEPISAGSVKGFTSGSGFSTEVEVVVDDLDVVEVVVEAVVVVIIGIEAGYASATRINSGQRL